jgi:hypothetical protein
MIKGKVKKKIITDLPIELLAKMLFNLTTSELLNVASVSRQFKELSNDEMFHKSITVNINNENIETSSLFLNRAIRLKRLRIRSTPILTFDDEDQSLYYKRRKTDFQCDPILLSLSNLQHLEELDVGRVYNRCQVKLSRSCLEDLTKTDWWLKLNHLSLTLEESKGSDDDERTSKAFSTLSQSGNIRHLNVSGLSRLLVLEQKLIMSFKGLTGLKLNQCFKQTDIRLMITQFKATIRILDFGCNFVGPPLYSTIEECSNLQSIRQELDFLFTYEDYEWRENEIWKGGACLNSDYDVIVDPVPLPFHILTKLNHLRSVKLTLLNDLEVSHLILNQSLPQLESLEVLAFYSSSDLLSALASACPNLKKLELKFYHGFVDQLDDQIKVVSENCKKLETLKVT